jgi:hypothetical protein
VLISCQEPSVATDHPVLPKALTLEAHCERDDLNKIHILGTTNFPDFTKLGINVVLESNPKRYAEDMQVHVEQGRFSSVGFTNGDKPFKPGPHKVKVFSYFNQFWQTSDNLKLFGDGGSNLNGPAIRLANPGLIDSDRVVDQALVLSFPPLKPVNRGNPRQEQHQSGELQSIALVKRARLSDDYGERSSLDVEHCVQFFMGTSGLTPNKGWIASPKTGSVYTVSYDFIDGRAGAAQAMWEVDLSSKKVRYINKRGMFLSFVPAE